LASAIIQLYLKHVLEAYFDVNPFIRQYAANVVDLVLKQGLIHPLQVKFHVGEPCFSSYLRFNWLYSRCRRFLVVGVINEKATRAVKRDTALKDLRLCS
jgi:Sister chromatid cohesion C-terminus